MVQPWSLVRLSSSRPKGKALAESSRIEQNDTNIMIIGYDNRVTNCENQKVLHRVRASSA